MQNEQAKGAAKAFNVSWPKQHWKCDLKRAVGAQQPRNLTELEDFCEE